MEPVFENLSKLFDVSDMSWNDKEDILNYLFQNNQIKLSEFIGLQDELHNKKSKWLEEKWKELQS